MSFDLHHLSNAFSRLRVLVVGEAMLDRYLEGFTNRLCQEAPVPVVTLSGCRNVPGGAANTAMNLCSLSCDVKFLSIVGEDLESVLLKQALEDCGVSTRYIYGRSTRQTLAKQRIMAGTQLLLRFDQGSTDKIDAQTEKLLIQSLSNLWIESDVIIVSDYGYGILTESVIETIAQLQSVHPKTLVVDAKNLTAYHAAHVTAAKPNYSQAMELLGNPVVSEWRSRCDFIIAQADHLLELTNAQIVAVTLDCEGAVILECGKTPYRTHAEPACTTRTIGAGDTYTATLAAALAAGATTQTAANLAATAGAIVVAKDGTSTCTLQELCDHIYATSR
jgi:D-beta-D-heptose 7-phosphate kinase / D-beta-D-heptose 1-phosphate adenosyltransferase